MPRSITKPVEARERPATLPLVRCAVCTLKATEEGLEQEFNSLDPSGSLPTRTSAARPALAGYA